MPTATSCKYYIYQIINLINESVFTTIHNYQYQKYNINQHVTYYISYILYHYHINILSIFLESCPRGIF